VLVTGGGRGIGLAAARLLSKAGDRVAVTYRTGEPPEGLFAVRCDVTEAGAVERAFCDIEERHGPVEVLVANAGTTRDRLVLRMGEPDFAEVIDTNLTGAYRVAKRASKAMLRARWGRLIFISSAVAFLGETGQANYAASKAGLVGLARSLARELGPRHITANVIAPGYTETDLTAGLSAERKAAMVERIPLGRPAAAHEIAAAIQFIASDDAGYITGAVIPVDGGVGMGH
jgi:3-oxoacyl-[acyl-carrier protein] reductase